MKTILPNQIKNAEQARVFLSNLNNNDELYHPEDNAFDVVWDEGTPEKKELTQLNKLMAEVHEHLNDPCAFCLTLPD